MKKSTFTDKTNVIFTWSPFNPSLSDSPRFWERLPTPSTLLLPGPVSGSFWFLHSIVITTAAWAQRADTATQSFQQKDLGINCEKSTQHLLLPRCMITTVSLVLICESHGDWLCTCYGWTKCFCMYISLYSYIYLYLQRCIIVGSSKLHCRKSRSHTCMFHLDLYF